jgi:hypothetical protein
MVDADQFDVVLIGDDVAVAVCAANLSLRVADAMRDRDEAPRLPQTKPACGQRTSSQIQPQV